MIDPTELRSAFKAAAAEMPDDLRLLGITCHGPEWVAIAGENGDPNVSCEGWGGTPLEALSDLVRHVREDAAGDGREYLLPLRDAVRKAEAIELGEPSRCS